MNNTPIAPFIKWAGGKRQLLGQICAKLPDKYNTFQPYQAYMATGEYPLSRNVYAILSEPRNGLATGFTRFLAGYKAQRVILRAGLVPATQSLRIVNVREEL